MDNITISQIAKSIGTITIISCFIVSIIKWYKKNFTDKFNNLEERIEVLEEKEENYQKTVQDSKSERLILLKAVLACLKGLQEQGIDGPVTDGIKEVEGYLVNKAHE